MAVEAEADNGGTAASRRRRAWSLALSFVPAAITVEGSAAVCPGESGRIEIVLASGARVIVGMDVDETALARVIKVLSRQR